jgi:hypothetical protein
VGYALPKVISLLTAGGVIPTSLPAEVTNFATPVTRPAAAPYSTVRRVTTPYVAPTAQTAPRRVDVYHAPEAHDEPAMTGSLWPLLGGPGRPWAWPPVLADGQPNGRSARRAGAGCRARAARAGAGSPAARYCQ